MKWIKRISVRVLGEFASPEDPNRFAGGSIPKGEGFSPLQETKGAWINDKKIRCAFVSIVVGAILAIGGAVSGALAAEKVSFFLDWVPYGKHASFYAGVKYGIYKKYGLDVIIQPGKSSGLSVKTIGAKGADYGHADKGTLIHGRSNNRDLKVKEIAMIHHNNLFNIVFLKSSGIKTSKDLESRKIGSAAMNSSKIVFPALARSRGWTPPK